MKHIPYTSRIFIGLFIITMLLTYIALTLSIQYSKDLELMSLTNLFSNNKPVTQDTKVELLDTTDWQNYTDKAYPLSFLYPTGWTVTATAPTDLGFYDITIKPLDKTPNFHISISNESFLGFDGLTTTPYKHQNLEGQSVNNNLIGLKSGEYYYTFDGSLNPKLLPEFLTLMNSVKFE